MNTEQDQADDILDAAIADTLQAIKLAQSRTDGNGHFLADQALCILLSIIGLSEIADEFDKVPKSYTAPQGSAKGKQ